MHWLRQRRYFSQHQCCSLEIIEWWKRAAKRPFRLGMGCRCPWYDLDLGVGIQALPPRRALVRTCASTSTTTFDSPSLRSLRVITPMRYFLILVSDC